MQKNSGMVLIIVLAMMFVLVSYVSVLHLTLRDLFISASRYESSCRARAIASAGVRVAMSILVKDKELSEIDSLHEAWNDPELIKQALSASGLSILPEVHIEDELSKIQINALVNRPNEVNSDQLELWDRFLSALILFDEELIGSRPSSIINPVIDWIDSEDDDRVTGLDGAEKDYYASLDPPYAPRNGPFTDLSELKLVRGISPELWIKLGGVEGLSRYMSVWGEEIRVGNTLKIDGRININTAPLEVIATLIKETSSLHMAEEIVAFRDEKSEGFYLNELEDKWYKNCPACESIPFAENLITQSSDIFSIVSTVVYKEVKLGIRAVIRREKNKEGRFFCRVLAWKEE